MAGYLLLAIALVSATMEKSCASLLRATVSAILGFALAGLYLLPAIWERGWANFGAAINERGYIIENGWLFHRHLESEWTQYDTSVNVHSWVAILMFGLSVAAVALAWKRGKLKADRALWIPLALIPVVVLFLQLPVSEPLWKLLPALRYLQFPWRWLVVMNAPLAVFFAAAVWVHPIRIRIAIAFACALLFLVATGTIFGVCFQDCHSVDTALPQVEQAEGIRGKPEYAPPGIRHALLEPGVVANCEVNTLGDLSHDTLPDRNAAQNAATPACTGKFVKMEDHPEHKVFMGTADRAGYLILHLRSFPAWRITVNGQPVGAAREEDYGLTAVQIPPGTVMVIADWTTTPDVWLGRAVSLLALFLLLGLHSLQRRWARAGLSLDECTSTSNR